jgi:hypothetical protein
MGRVEVPAEMERILIEFMLPEGLWSIFLNLGRPL